MKHILKRLFCRHKQYVFECDFSYRLKEDFPMRKRYHDVTIACEECGKRKSFRYYERE